MEHELKNKSTSNYSPVANQNGSQDESQTVVHPGFPIGGDPLVGCGPLIQVLFGKNVCENERIGSHRGHAPGMPPLDPPMTDEGWL